MSRRRHFLAQLGAAAAALAIDSDELRAATQSSTSGWDTSWLDRLATAQYRVVFNASEINDGAAMDYAATFFDHFHEVHGTSDKQTRPVIVFRRLGTGMAFNDILWDRYAIGEETKIRDAATQAPARRNVFWTARPGASAQSVATKLDALQARGLISLVCNVAANNIASRWAEKFQRPVEVVRKDVTDNLIPGAILVPSGIYALIRAQNAGCAYMPGT
jgi:intracellular sulfur oxidation DsrE/DsrF family protein